MKLELAEWRYRVPMGFADRCGYRSRFVFDGGRHVMDFYRVQDRMGVLPFCRRCGSRLDVPFVKAFRA